MHLVCGEALYDVFVDDPEPALGHELVLKALAGGSPFNVAIGMARLGARVGLASDLARDVLGDRLVAQLIQEGVADLFWRRSAATSALAIVATDDAGHPNYSFSGLEQAVYYPAAGSVEPIEATISGLHLGSIATVLPHSSGLLLDLAQRLADHALVSLDPNIRLSIVPEPATWIRAIEDLRGFCHLIKVSEEDIVALYGDIDPDAACRAWLTDRTALVVLTRGAQGATMFTRAVGRVEIPSANTVVVDTVGAGDSFMAALLSTLTKKGWVTSEAIASLNARQLFSLGTYAAIAASVTCSRRGPMLPTTLDLEALGAQMMDDDI